MPTIHDDIEPWLAASVHGQLSKEEREEFQAHLAECATCRALHEEELTMNNMIASTLEPMKPDLAFEQRIVSGFRRQVLNRRVAIGWFAALIRSRATLIAAGAAVLLTLVAVGNWLTNPSAYLGNEELAVAPKSSLDELRMRNALGNESVDSMERNARQFARNTPREGSRQLPSFTGKSSVENDTKGGNSAVVAQNAPDRDDRVIITGSFIPTSPTEETLPATVYGGSPLKKQGANAPAVGVAPAPSESISPATPTAEYESALPPETPSPAAGPDVNRKLVRNAQVELEVLKFDEAVQKITAFATEDRGYIATSSSEKQANGKLRGEVVVKVLPERLDEFLLKLRGLGDLKNQTLGTDDVTKQYFDTDARLQNARVMETRLIDILKTKSNKVADLLEVEKELGRVRASIEQMQGELKYMDAQVAFATVTITLTEKDMDVPAAFLLKRHAQLALFSPDVEKTFAEVKGVIDGAKAQISSSTLDRDSAGEATARLVLLIVPEEADALIERIKGMGRAQNYNEQTDRIAQGGSGMAEGAKVERDKVELSITISRNEQEPALQTTTLGILTSGVSEKVARLKEDAAKAGAEIRSSSFNRNPDGQEFANISLRVAMKNYPALLSSFDQLGKVKDVSVQRQDRRGKIDEATAPADINIQVYSQPNIIADEGGVFATIRRTLMQGAAALMWSLRMIGVALAFVAPWVLALALVVWVLRRISRSRRAKKNGRTQH